MQTRSLGPSAPAVSIVGYGGMPLSTAGRPDPTTAERTIHAALDAGITLIDTADVYCLDHTDIGHNERVVAAALASWGGDLDDVFVATKGGMTRPDGRWEPSSRSTAGASSPSVASTNGNPYSRRFPSTTTIPPI